LKSLYVTIDTTVSTIVRGRRVFGYSIDIDVYVTDSAGNPLFDIWVLVWVCDSTGEIVYSVAGQTDDSGHFTTSYSPDASGTYCIYAIVDDYYNGYHYAYNSTSVTV